MMNQRREQHATAFQSVEEFLRGTWRLSLDGDPHGTGWLHFTADGRAVQFTIFDSEPQRRMAQRFWYEVEAADTLRFRPRLDHGGWTRSCLRQDDSSFVLGAGDIVFPCARLLADDCPDWFDEALGQQLTQFNWQ